MGQGSAKRLVDNMVELESKLANGTFIRTMRVGDIVFIIQRCSNYKGKYVSVQEIHKGGRRGSIIIPEGKNGCRWQGFGFELRLAIGNGNTIETTKPRTVKSVEMAGVPGANASMVAVASGKGWSPSGNNGGGGEKGKQSILGKVPIIKEKSPTNPPALTLNMDTKDLGVKENNVTQLSLTIQIACGQDGLWTIKHASVDLGSRLDGPAPHMAINRPGPIESLITPPMVPAQVRPKPT
ncbi:pentatricopeptide repeat-containing protein [Fagus crenata]